MAVVDKKKDLREGNKTDQDLRSKQNTNVSNVTWNDILEGLSGEENYIPKESKGECTSCHSL